MRMIEAENMGGYHAPELNCGEISWDNHGDYSNRWEKNFFICFEEGNLKSQNFLPITVTFVSFSLIRPMSLTAQKVR